VGELGRQPFQRQRFAGIDDRIVAGREDRADLDAMIANDPYTKGNVWQRVEVKPVQLVVRDGKITP